MAKRVFLGGTCNHSTWREELIPMLLIDYYNPVVAEWTPECLEEEIKQRKVCDWVLYTITSEMIGVYSIAELVDDSNKRPEKTVFCLLRKGFTDKQLKSLAAVTDMIRQNGAKAFESLNDTADYLNS